MLDTSNSTATNKEEFYVEVKDQIASLVEGQTNWVANLANASSLIYHGLRQITGKPINWVGFYLLDPFTLRKPIHQDQPWLILGPFQGKVACVEIKFGRGVCGTAALTNQTLLVKDVHDFPGHIACDSASNSEIVIPMVYNGQVIGVLDLDCEVVEGFDEVDQAGLEAIVALLVPACDWRGVVVPK